MAIKTTPWDVTEHLQSEDEIAAYLQVVAEEDDPDAMKVALALVESARVKHRGHGRQSSE